MKTTFRFGLTLAAGAFAIVTASTNAVAQSTDNAGAAVLTRASDAAAGAQAKAAASPIPSEFGTSDYSILQIGSAAFSARTTTNTLSYVGTGLRQGSVGGFNYWAPVNLPEGSVIGFVDLYGCDTNASSHMQIIMTGYSGSTTPATNDFFGPSSSQITSPASGCGYFVSAPGSTFVVNNNVQYNGGYEYVLNLSFGATDGSNLFKGADIWWKRQVSPGPATATFTDVPTSSPQFKFVEALVAAGITAGCGGGNYCPNQAVTRGQMAVFLSVALGLHFPL